MKTTIQHTTCPTLPVQGSCAYEAASAAPSEPAPLTALEVSVCPSALITKLSPAASPVLLSSIFLAHCTFFFIRPLVIIVLMPFLLSLTAVAQVSQYNYATGSVTGRNYVGGLAGRATVAGTVISNSYAKGSVTGEQRVGGLVGHNGVAIEKSYSTGKVTGITQTGGFAGAGTGTVTASYWDTQTSLQTGSAGGTGRATDPMTYPYSADTYAGWNFSSVWKPDMPPAQNGGYPLLAVAGVYRLNVQVFPLGAGTVTGGGDYLSGQQAQLMAVGDTGYVFSGWMDGNTLVSTQPGYGFSVTRSLSLVAKYRLKTTSISEPIKKRNETLAIYPNPVEQTLHVDLGSMTHQVTALRIINLSGQTMIYLNPAEVSARGTGSGQTFTNGSVSGQAVTTNYLHGETQPDYSRQSNNLTGRLTVDVSQLPAGVYIAVASHSTGLTTARFIKR